MEWSEPELLLWWDGEALDERPGWNADWAIVDGPGYPDFCVLSDGRLGYVQSNKLTLRFHIVDPRSLELLRRQHLLKDVVKDSLRVNIHAPTPRVYRSFNLGDCRSRTGGFTIVIQVKGGVEVKPEEVLLDATELVTATLDEEDGGDFVTKGFEIRVKGAGKSGLQLQLLLTDGWSKVKHVTEGLSWDSKNHTVAFTCDNGPRMITSLVDVRLNDGDVYRPEGHTSLPAKMNAIGGANIAVWPAPTVRRPHTGPFKGKILNLLLYNRPLLTSETISIARALAANPAAAAPGKM